MNRARKSVVLVPGTLVASLALAMSASAAGLGNSAEAEKCKDGGWMHQLQENQSPFNNQGACVSYVVQGGKFYVPHGGGTAPKPE